MTRKALWILCILTLMFSSSLTVAATTVTLPTGTPVIAEVMEDIHPAIVATGDKILFRVGKDVKVGGCTVIKKGANIVGQVAEAKEKEYGGQAGRIIVSFRHVQAVDGQDIALSGSSRREGDDKMIESVGLGLVCCPLFLLMKGEEGVITAGQTVMVYTIQKTEVTVKE